MQEFEQRDRKYNGISERFLVRLKMGTHVLSDRFAFAIETDSDSQAQHVYGHGNRNECTTREYAYIQIAEFNLFTFVRMTNEFD